MSVIAGMFFPNLLLSAPINLATGSAFGVLIIVSAIIAMLVGALIALKQKEIQTNTLKILGFLISSFLLLKTHGRITSSS